MFSMPYLTHTPPKNYNRDTMRPDTLTTQELKQLAQSELMRGASAEVAARMNPLWKHKLLRAGETFLTAQQPGDALYFVISGTIKIHVEQADGSDVFIDISAAGDVVGEMSIMDNAARSASATAMEETRVLWMERTAIESEMNETPLIAINLARILSHRLRHATERIQVMATRDTFGRVAHQLQFFQNKYGRRTAEGILIPVRLTQGDLADLVGATRERVNHVMGVFKRENILKMDAGSHVTVLDSSTLAKYVTS